jgi:hypothetical protein
MTTLAAPIAPHVKEAPTCCEVPKLEGHTVAHINIEGTDCDASYRQTMTCLKCGNVTYGSASMVSLEFTPDTILEALTAIKRQVGL